MLYVLKDMRITVSILALPEGRALQEQGYYENVEQVFQSSPFPKEGRYGDGAGIRPQLSSFNPRPSRRKGATLAPCDEWRRSPCFNPRPSRRKGATMSSAHCWQDSSCFNPRPSRRKGATLHRRNVNLLSQVSILALPEGRALPTRAPEPIRASRFQSSPFPKEGRYSSPRRLRASNKVSILALPEGRALPHHGCGSHAGDGVSILALPEGRALRQECGLCVQH